MCAKKIISDSNFDDFDSRLVLYNFYNAKDYIKTKILIIPSSMIRIPLNANKD